jgi:tRNA pseudouridine38-40 synthase
MPRIALGLEYDGSAFSGWQTQAHASGVQAALEKALSRVANHPVEVIAAGRTDAGVHALMQVVHFDSDSVRSERGWVLGANTYAPTAISALWAREVSDAFHARHSAFARRYRYVILNRTPRPAVAAQRVSWIRDPLDAALMHTAAQALIGEHDFTSFRASECQARTPMRQMHEITVERRGELIVISVLANAFLHHMVRNIAGVLIAIGAGERPVHWAAEVLAARDRKQGGITAPPAGLYLVGVRYAQALRLPSEPVPVLPAACPVHADQV